MRLRRLISRLLVPILVAVGFSAIAFSSTPAQALSGSKFDPGLIISDSVFYDFGTMNVESIQAFLDSKIPKCSSGSGPTCLNKYVMDTPAKDAEDGKCQAIEAKTAQTAAMIIYSVARACGINPRVLIVTLQKEQGLVQATNPSTYMYKAAMGYGCPDSDPAICGNVWTGLFNQLYKAAGQFQWYGDSRGSFTYLRPGKNISINYSPTSGCGKASFLLKSQATANLYYYTPYTPNKAALDNLYGTGDSCSAYGNRNFWRFYWDWFGSPIGGGFLLKSASSDPYLVVNDVRYKVTDSNLLKSLAPLGPLGTISDDYLNSFNDGGALTPLVKDALGNYWMISDGRRYKVTDCVSATNYGLDCALAVQLTSSQLAALPASGTLTPLVSGLTNDVYLIKDSQIHEVLDTDSLVAAGIEAPALSPVKISAFANLTWGAPIAQDGSTFVNRDTSKRFIFVDSVAYQVADETSDIDLGTSFIKSTSTLSTLGLGSSVSKLKLTSIIQDAAGSGFILTGTGKRAIGPVSGAWPKAPSMPAAVLNRFVDETPLTLPALMKTATGTSVYLVRNAQKRLTDASRKNFAAELADSEVEIVAGSVLKEIKTGLPAQSPATFVQLSSSGPTYLVDGFSRLLLISSQKQAALLGAKKPKLVTAKSIAGYAKSKPISSIKFACDTVIYIAVDGKYYEASPELAAHYPTKSVSLSPSTCASLKKSSVALGRFITGPAKIVYLVQNGKRRPISTATQYAQLRGDGAASVKVSADFLNLFPIGKKAPNSIDGEVNPMPSDSPSPSPKPTGTPTPSPTGTPSPTPTPSPTHKTYTVVSGDTLTKIATKFSTTVTAIKLLNGLTSDLIYIGQVLLIP